MDGNYVTVDLDAIYQNMQAVKEKVGVAICGVVKADAYGHGAVPVAKTIDPLCSFFGVSSVSEAMELRGSGIKKPILLLGYTHPSDFPQVVEQDLRPAIFTYEDAAALSSAAQKLQKTARFHFAVDTGMSRIGFQVTPENADICREIANLPCLEAEGVFSHYATADCADLSRAQQQTQRFDAFCAWLEQRGVSVKIRHMDNSAGIMNFPSHYDMVRSGIVTYGLYPSDAVKPQDLPIIPAMRWYSMVSHVKQLEPGREIGYGATFTVEKPMTVATVSVGYADGYPRALSNRFYVLIAGRKAKVLGRVCMDQIVVDITHIPGVKAGDKVTLLGETISAEEISAAAGSFNYEFVCGVSRRVPRYYYRDGSCVLKTHYLLDK